MGNECLAFACEDSYKPNMSGPTIERERSPIAELFSMDWLPSPFKQDEKDDKDHTDSVIHRQTKDHTLQVSN